MAAHVVIQKLFAVIVDSCCLICKIFTADHFILQLDVGQLVFELGCVRAFDHLVGGGEDQFEYKVGVQSLWVENAVVSEDLMIEIDAIFFCRKLFPVCFRRQLPRLVCLLQLNGS